MPKHRATGVRSSEFTGLARGSAWNLVGAVVSALANLVLAIVVARGVSATDAGKFFTLTSLFLVLEGLCRLGSDTGLIYFIARWRALGQRAHVQQALRAAQLPAAGFTIVIALAVLLFAPQIARLAGVGSGPSISALRALAVLLPIAVLYDLAIAATRGFGRMRPTVVVDKVLRPVLQLVLVIIAVKSGWHDISAAWAIPYVATLVLAFWMLRSIARPEPVGLDRAERRAAFREFWLFSLPRAVAGVAQVLLQRLDIVLVAAIAGVADAAVYAASTRFLVAGQFVNQAIAAPVQPRLSALLAKHDFGGAKRLFAVSTSWLVLGTWPVFCLAICLAPTYVAIFGHHYHSGATVVVILAASMLLANACGLVDNVIIMAGKTSWNLWTTLLALVVNIGVDVALIPHFGIVGAAIGWTASIAAANVVPTIVCWRLLKLHPFAAANGYAMALCAICFLAVPLVAGLAVHDGQVGVIIGAVLGGIGYGLGVWRGRRALALTGGFGARTAKVRIA
jgi:O-antigen/teichoic acid export membrane protein